MPPISLSLPPLRKDILTLLQSWTGVPFLGYGNATVATLSEVADFVGVYLEDIVENSSGGIRRKRKMEKKIHVKFLTYFFQIKS